MLSIQYLDPVAFLTAHNNTVDIDDPDNIVNRPDNISFMKFNCTMNGASQDACVTQADTPVFQFFLCLSRHLFDVAAITYSVVSVPFSTTKKLGTSCLLGVCFASMPISGSTTPCLLLPLQQQELHPSRLLP